MRSTPVLILGAGLVLGQCCAKGLTQEVFDAIDKQGEGLRNVNEEVIISFRIHLGVEITLFQDYWDQNPSFQLASQYYKLQMQHFNPAEDRETANFTVTAPEDDPGQASASSDQGNVSWFLPSIQVGFPVGGTAPVHDAGFRELAGTDFAHEQAIKTAKVLALTGIQVLQNETFAETMWSEWKEMIAEISVGLEESNGNVTSNSTTKRHVSHVH